MSAPIDDGGPAFPHDERDANGQFRQHFGMTLRDWFAQQTPSDEITNLTSQHLSLLAQEKLAGMKRPERNHDERGDAAISKQIETIRFHARVNAALRYIFADAMIEARKEPK